MVTAVVLNLHPESLLNESRKGLLKVYLEQNTLVLWVTKEVS